MVVKTDICSFTEFRIYPGHGIRFVRKDGQVVTFINSKSKSMYHQRKKPAKLVWTLAWRKTNKKGLKDEHAVKRKRKIQKFQRAVVGLNLEELKRKKTQKPEVRAAKREAAMREAKEKKKTAKAKAKQTKAASKASKPAPQQKRGKGKR